MKSKVLIAVAALVACSGAWADGKEVTICEDYISDGGRSYLLQQNSDKCTRAMRATTRAQKEYFRTMRGKSVWEYYEAEEKKGCADIFEMLSDVEAWSQPKTIERKCEIYIDNRAKEG